MSDPLIVGAMFILLHRIDGGEVQLNPAHITNMQATTTARGGRNILMTDQARCVLGLSSGKFLSVIETCEAVKQLINNRR